MPPALVEEVGKDWKYPLAGNLNVEDPPDHMRMKKIMVQAFNASITGMAPWITATVNRLIDAFSGSHEVDIVQAFNWPLTVAAIAHVLGVADEDTGRFREWAEAWFELSGSSDLPVERSAQCWKSLVDMDRFVRRMISSRREQPREDLTSRVVEAQAKGARISDQEIVSNLFGLLAAGSDTTAQLLGQLIYLLLNNRDQFELLKKDRSLIDNAIEEALRVRGPVRGLIRTTLQDSRVGDVVIPSGSKVYLHVGSASRDEAVFQNPDRFDIQRSNARKHVSLGAFTRLCLGAPLARLEVRIALSTLMDRLPSLRLSPSQGPLAYSNSMIVPSIKQLRVAW
jgi:cytochrome P450